MAFDLTVNGSVDADPQTPLPASLHVDLCMNALIASSLPSSVGGSQKRVWRAPLP